MKGYTTLLGLSVLAIIVVSIKCDNPNNVCKTFKDYYTKSVNPNCWYDPAVTANASELILSHGYPLEVHEAITDDSHILTVLRIPPRGKINNGIVFLQHPALGCCVNWLDLGNVSLAFLFADAGYDVWLGNFRGTIYSDKHVYLSTSSNQYWNHSFHEMGIYDLPAQFDLVREQTHYKDKIYYISHSMSGTAAFIYASLRPQHAKDNVKLFINWSPVAYMKHVTGLPVHFAPFAGLAMFIGEALHSLNFIPHNGLLHKLIILFCAETPWTMEQCFLLLQAFQGYDSKYFLPERMPIIFKQNFAGLSLKVLTHYDQIVHSGGKFQFYDYGLKDNMLYYHSKKPPLYPIEEIKVPMCSVYGGKDAFAVEKDVVNFYNKLPKETRYCIKKIDPYNHIDFQYGRDVEKMVFDYTMNTVKQFKGVK